MNYPDFHVEWISSVPKPRPTPFLAVPLEVYNSLENSPHYYSNGHINRSLADSFETLALQEDMEHSSGHTSSTPVRTPIQEQLIIKTSSSSPLEGNCEIFVGRLNPHKVDQEMVYRRFADYGEIVSVHLINKRKTTGIPQDAFAFITYKNSADACKAIESEHGKAWMGQAIKVAHSIPKLEVDSHKNFMYASYGIFFSSKS
jgi:RNA recognition motif-containing protein